MFCWVIEFGVVVDGPYCRDRALDGGGAKIVVPVFEVANYVKM